MVTKKQTKEMLDVIEEQPIEEIIWKKIDRAYKINDAKSKKDFMEYFKEDIKTRKGFILLEDYNLPDIFGRYFSEKVNKVTAYMEYFSDCDGGEDMLLIDIPSMKLYKYGVEIIEKEWMEEIK